MATSITNKGIEVVFRLPYRLILPAGEYAISPRQHSLQIAHPEVLEYTVADEPVQLDCTERSVVCMFHEASLMEDTLEQEFKRCIGITISVTNRFLQWYRFHTQHAQAIELVVEQVSPILLNLVQDQQRQTRVQRYDPLTRRLQPLTEEQLDHLKQNLLQRTGPPTEHLLLLEGAQES